MIVTPENVATIIVPREWVYRDPRASPLSVVWDPGGAPVYRPAPDLNTAVWMLRDAVRKMTGRTLVIAEEGAVPPAGAVIYLGRTACDHRHCQA